MEEVRRKCPFLNYFRFKCRYRYGNGDCVDLAMCPAAKDSWCCNQIKVARLLNEAVERLKLYNEGR